ncbi:predicted protein [Nematostella vectensis]|uniref:Calponin-homology (CH) domain-containing protein n=1 Tax=Nematostella vectensis TaxID=45351 RepID=A7T767_NEMVE|nr:predicted protein [Nematostella vectensis]|eukprot:XP_001620285.1 hypothetical protein NEMVEDRAFT_v1g148601 [Nematostella vectensis]
MIEPRSLEDPKVMQLKTVLLEWINEELADKRIVVRNVEEDLYDGLILAHLMGKSMHTIIYFFQAKLSVLIGEINKVLLVPQHRAKWTPERIHSKDTVAILHLLVALARHFNNQKKLTPDVKIHTMHVQKKGGVLVPQRVIEEITGPDHEYVIFY